MKKIIKATMVICLIILLSSFASASILDWINNLINGDSPTGEIDKSITKKAIYKSEFMKKQVTYIIDKNYPIERVDENCFKTSVIDKVELLRNTNLKADDITKLDNGFMTFKVNENVQNYDYTKENIICHNKQIGTYKWGFNSSQIEIANITIGVFNNTIYNATKTAVHINFTLGVNGTYTSEVFALNASYNMTNVTMNSSSSSGFEVEGSVREKRMNLTEGLISYYDFEGDDLGITTCTDIWGTNDGIVKNEAVGIEVVQGRGVLSDDNIDNDLQGCEVATNNFNQIDGGGFTIFIEYIYYSQPSNEYLFDYHNDIKIMGDITGFYFTVDGLTTTSNTDWGLHTPNIWSKTFFYYNTSHLCFYSNEGGFDCIASTGDVASAAGTANIGAVNNGLYNNMNGSIDNLIIWNRSLTNAEMNCILNQQCLSNWTDWSNTKTFSNGVHMKNFSINATSNFIQTKFNIYANAVQSSNIYDFNITFFNHTITGGAPPSDSEAPLFTETPKNQTLELGVDSLFIKINATDETSTYFKINDTTRFNITFNGSLTNKTLLIGTYILNVSVNDTDNNLNSTYLKFIVQDTIAPNISLIPANATLEYYTDALSSDFEAEDYNQTYYRINDTNFNITQEGVLKNATALSIGTYTLNVSVNDSSNNVNSTYFKVTVQDTTPPVFTQIPANQTLELGIDNLLKKINATDATSTYFKINDTIRFNITFNGSLTNNTALAIGTYTLNVSVNDSLHNLNSTYLQFIVQDTLAPVVSNVRFWAIDNSGNVIGNGSYFNTANLTVIEKMKINFTLTDGTGFGGDISFYYTANGSNACSRGNLQNSICYNTSTNTWIEVRNNTNTSSFDDKMAAGDYINMTYVTVSSTVRKYTIIIDEHYNPNVYKKYDAIYNFSDVKWQDGTNQRITKSNYFMITADSDLPLIADQYKIDLRVNYTQGGFTPTDPLLICACNQTYLDLGGGDPSVNINCELIAEKMPSELTDDGTKFRAIETANVLDNIGTIKYFILTTDENNQNKYYYIKTIKSMGTGYLTDWNYSTDSGLTYSHLGDGYEVEANINTFFNAANPTAFVFKLFSNDTNDYGTNSSNYSMTWNINPNENYAPLLDIIVPEDNASVSGVIDINWTLVEPNDDNTLTNVTAKNTVTTVDILTNAHSSITNVTWDTFSYAGLWNITVTVCENETTDLFCISNTHRINILDTIAPKFTQSHQNDTLSYLTLVSKKINATDAINIDKFFINDTTRFNITFNGSLTNATVLGVDTYYLNISVNDTSGNVNSTYYSLTVTQATTALTLVSAPSWTETTGTQTTVTGAACPSQLTCTLRRNNSISSNPDIQTLAVGHYNYTYYNQTSNQNYTNDRIENTLIISAAPLVGVGRKITIRNETTKNILFEFLNSGFFTAFYRINTRTLNVTNITMTAFNDSAKRFTCAPDSNGLFVCSLI